MVEVRSGQIPERFWDFADSWDFSFSIFLHESHAWKIPNFEFHGKGVESLSLGPFLPRRLLGSLCNSINPFFRALVPREAKVLRSFRNPQRRIATNTSFSPFFWGQGVSLWVSHFFFLGPGRQSLGLTGGKGGPSNNIFLNPIINPSKVTCFFTQREEDGITYKISFHRPLLLIDLCERGACEKRFASYKK